MAKSQREKTFEELADDLLTPQDGHQYLAAKAELDTRQIKAILDATEAQKAAANAEQRAADASVVSARATKRNANYMLASVVVAAISAIASAFSAYYAYLSSITHH
jgi:hypothetical protein